MRQKRLYGLLMVSIIVFSLGGCEEEPSNKDIRDQLIGSWSVVEQNNLKSTDYYTVTIIKSLIDTTKIRISNFYAIDGTVEATVTDYYITLPEQLAEGFTFEGFGDIALTMKKIVWSYTVNHNNGFIDNVTATYTKK